MKSMGSEVVDEENDYIMPEALKSPNAIGDILKPPPMNCIPGCRVQANAVEMSYANYPKQKTFYYQKDFCYLASHIRYLEIKIILFLVLCIRTFVLIW